MFQKRFKLSITILLFTFLCITSLWVFSTTTFALQPHQSGDTKIVPASFEWEDGFGVIVGRVTGQDGLFPLEKIEVIAYQWDRSVSYWRLLRSAMTDTKGYYRITNLLSGTYKLVFNDRSGDFYKRYYNNQSRFEMSDPISVVAGKTVTGIDVSLLPRNPITLTNASVSTREAGDVTGSHIQGRVTAPDGTTPLQSIYVYAYMWNSSYSYWSHVLRVSTDADGNYDLGGIGAGTYRIKFQDDSGQYITECYNNQAGVDSADDIVVGEAESVTGIDASLAPSSHIKGRVTALDGTTPLQSVRVEACVWNASGPYWNSVSNVFTDADGNYNLGGIGPGTYRIGFGDHYGKYIIEYYNNHASVYSADDIVIGDAKSVTGIDASLEVSSHIKGRVTAPDGTTPLQSVRVEAYVWNASGPYWNGVSNVSTDTDGNYDLGGFGAGTYRIQFWDSSGQYVTEYYNNQSSLNLADDIVVGEEESVTGIDASLEPSSHIKGRVTASDGTTPLQNGYVQAYMWNESGSNWNNVSGVSIDVNGNYDLGGIGPGTYRIVFRDDSGQYASEYYNNQASLESADDIVVGEEESVTGIDASLEFDNQDVGFISVALLPDTAITEGAKWNVDNGEWQDSGSTLSNLTVGTHTVYFKAIDGWIKPENKIVTIVTDQTTNINAAYTPQQGLPIVTTDAVVNVGTATATVNATITDLGNSNPTAHGVCWNRAGTGVPTLSDNYIDEGGTSTIGSFTSVITGLNAGTRYYVRAYAVNLQGTAYGSNLAFTTMGNAAGFVVSSISGNTYENGTSAEFTVSLAGQPQSDVSINLSSSDPGEGTVSPSTLIFTSTDWETLQTVTVTGVDDAVVDGNQQFAIQFESATSSDTNYHGIKPDDVLVANEDNDGGPTQKPLLFLMLLLD